MNLVLIPMVTLVFEDFTGWLAGIVVDKAVMEMLNLVLNNASFPDWGIRVFVAKDGEFFTKYTR